MKGRTILPGLAHVTVLLACLAALAPGSGSASVRHPSWAVPAAPRLAAPVASTDAIVATSARVIESGATSQLLIDLTGKVEPDVFLIASPAGVVVDLPALDFRLDPRAAASSHDGLIRAFRCGLFAPGRSRIVIDLAGPAVVRKASVEPLGGAGGAARLVIELARTDLASFHAAVRRQQPPAIVLAPALAEGRSSQPAERPVIVIDAGHGGIDPGAAGTQGANEKTIVLDFASGLAAKLKAGGRYDVVMTRTDDTFVSLGERVRIARDANASLFISVHADTLSDPAVAGATVYAAADRASDAEAARVADDENRSDEAAGVEASPEAPGVSDILFDLTRRETRTYAHVFQHTLVGYWQKIARVNKNPERSAGFKVLQAPDVPSVLLELGYLSSEKDAASLLSPEWRNRAADTVVGAVDAFFARRPIPVVATGLTAQTAALPGEGVVSAQPHP